MYGYGDEYGAQREEQDAEDQQAYGEPDEPGIVAPTSARIATGREASEFIATRSHCPEPGDHVSDCVPGPLAWATQMS